MPTDLDLLMTCAPITPKPIPSAADPAYHEGEDDHVPDTTPIVMRVAVEVLIRSEGKEWISTRPLHEIPLLRRLHGLLGGSVEISPQFAMGLSRIGTLTRAQLQAEIARLDRDYRLARDGETLNIFRQQYGTGNACRLGQVMRTLFTAWTDLLRAKLPLIRPQAERIFPGRALGSAHLRSAANQVISSIDLEKVLALADEQPPQLEPLSELPLMAATEAHAEESQAQRTPQELLNLLGKAGIDESIALRVSQLNDHSATNLITNGIEHKLAQAIENILRD